MRIQWTDAAQARVSTPYGDADLSRFSAVATCPKCPGYNLVLRRRFVECSTLVRDLSATKNPHSILPERKNDWDEAGDPTLFCPACGTEYQIPAQLDMRSAARS